MISVQALARHVKTIFHLPTRDENIVNDLRYTASVHKKFISDKCEFILNYWEKRKTKWNQVSQRAQNLKILEFCKNLNHFIS